MNELKKFLLDKLATIDYFEVVNEKYNSVDMNKIVDVICDAIAEYLKGGEPDARDIIQR